MRLVGLGFVGWVKHGSQTYCHEDVLDLWDLASITYGSARSNLFHLLYVLYLCPMLELAQVHALDQIARSSSVGFSVHTGPVQVSEPLSMEKSLHGQQKRLRLELRGVETLMYCIEHSSIRRTAPIGSAHTKHDDTVQQAWQHLHL